MDELKNQSPAKKGESKADLRSRIAHLESLVGAGPTDDGSTELPALEGTAVAARAQVQEAIDALSEGFLFFDAEERMVLCNRTYREYFTPSSKQLVTGMSFEEWARIVAFSGQVAGAAGREEAWIAQRLEDFRNPGETKEYDFGGRKIQIREYKTASGGTAGLRTDVTLLRESERRAAEARELLMDAIESSPDGIGIYDSDDRLVVFNQKFRGDMLSDIADLIEPGVAYETLLRAAVDRDLVEVPDGEVEKYIAERMAHHRDGDGNREVALKNDRWLLARERRMRGGGIIGIRADITEMKRAETALRESEELLRAVVDNSTSALLLKDTEGRFRLMNRKFEEWYGFNGEAIGKTAHDMQPGSLADEFVAQDEQVLATGEPLEHEFDATFTDGTVHQVRMTKFPVRDSAGRVIGVGAIGSDVTEQRRTEEQLRQAQKMEAVGQLTGGVAHDFNNLLAVIQGNLELLEDMIGVNTELLDPVARATKASRRAADLTQRLLAFSRKQTLQPRFLDLSVLVAGMGELLRRTLGETIEVVAASAGGLWRCEVDPSQLENALLNLAINARDAMPAGGKLTIETGNARLDDDYAAAQAEVEPGQYVLLAVSDTGTGMSPEMAERAFDPFFTTKEVGKGSGLGLSMIYGFVKQSGGHVRIYSEEGEGTTVKIYLPRATHEVAPEPAAEAKPKAPEGRGEIVLVVEDDPEVRTLTIVLLQNLGYATLDAQSGLDALAISERARGIDLLLTDVVLPGGMNGRDLATEILSRRPGLPVLYMSGYTQDAVVHHGRLDEGVELLHKPFRKHELAAKVRHALVIANS